MTWLPSLSGLRTFEAAARRLSFTEAADELSVTQTAVSHQVRRLEVQLGVTLFVRKGRALELTEAGRTLLPSVSSGFEALRSGVQALRRHEDQTVLTVTTIVSFATKWLVPRLSAFRAAHPDIDLRLLTSTEINDLDRDDIDVAIRWGNGDWSDSLLIEKLMSEDLFPVCAPSLLEQGPPLARPEDLAHHTLLHTMHFADDWRMWLTAAGVRSVDPAAGPKFDLALNAIQAAIDGGGVALAHAAFVESDLAAGRLVVPFECRLPSEAAYYVVSPRAAAEQPKIARFRQWLMAEVARGETEDSGSNPSR